MSGWRRPGSTLAEGLDKIENERRLLGQIVAANYQSGDPGLMGLSMVLTTQDPTELTGQLNSVHNVMDKESVVLDRLEASKALLTVQEHEVAAAKAEVARQRRAAAANLVRRRGLEAQAEAAAASVHRLVAARATARRRGRAGQERRPGPAAAASSASATASRRSSSGAPTPPVRRGRWLAAVARSTPAGSWTTPSTVR